MLQRNTLPAISSIAPAATFPLPVLITVTVFLLDARDGFSVLWINEKAEAYHANSKLKDGAETAGSVSVHDCAGTN